MKNAARVFVSVCLSLSLDAATAQPPGGGLPQNFDLADQAREPIQVFDNLYSVGVEFVSSFLLTTSDGLILIDALFDMPGYQEYLFNNIRKVGFDPNDIRFVVVTHGHRDHYGLARALQDSTDAVIGTTSADWEMIENDLGERAPQRDWTIGQDEMLTLGDTTLRFDITPGHTPGVVSIEFQVVDRGRRHKAYLHGGPAARTNEPAGLQEFIDGLERAKTIEDIEVRLSNHPFIDNFFARAQQLTRRGADDPHPFVDPGEFYEWADGVIESTRQTMEGLR